MACSSSIRAWHARRPAHVQLQLQLRLHATVESEKKRPQETPRLFKFNGRNARGDSTSEATTVPVMLEKQLPVPGCGRRVEQPGVELPGLAWSWLSS